MYTVGASGRAARTLTADEWEWIDEVRVGRVFVGVLVPLGTVIVTDVVGRCGNSRWSRSMYTGRSAVVICRRALGVCDILADTAALTSPEYERGLNFSLKLSSARLIKPLIA